jgi:hypothetical protein
MFQTKDGASLVVEMESKDASLEMAAAVGMSGELTWTTLPNGMEAPPAEMTGRLLVGEDLQRFRAWITNARARFNAKRVS